MNIHTLLPSLFVLLATLPSVTRANFTITVVQPPSGPNGHFAAAIVGGDAADPTRNPCYGVAGCDLRFFTIDESWLPSGRGGYGTLDGDNWTMLTHTTAAAYPTIGAWWENVKNRDRIGVDYLPVSHGDRPCVVLAASRDGIMIVNSIVSNCARGLIQVPSCSITPGQINVTFDTTAGREPGEKMIPDVRVTCSTAVDLRIETNSSEEIPLGGDNTSVAILDWGNGYGRPGGFNMRANEIRSVPLKVKTRGVARLGPGSYTGSGIVNITYH
mgnify:CR=1 FL=1